MLSVSTASAKEIVRGDWSVAYKGKRHTLYYQLSLPEEKKFGRTPVLVCVGGLNAAGGQYNYSGTNECQVGPWVDWAQSQGLAVLGLGFLFDPEDWENKESYQYAQAWSGDALIELLDHLDNKYAIDERRLMMFGISAGAQFSTRFGQYFPERVKAVASHAAGGYDPIQNYNAVKYLITVGEKDNNETKRVDFAKHFAAQAEKKGIDVSLHIIPGVGHRQTKEQDQLSREFFETILKERK